jgi:prepilin-type N-terminal cleavage/methylation domain-containing protein
MNIAKPGARRDAGFTLIEIIIVIAISAVLATIAIAYNSAERDTVALSVETAKISQTILDAKGLALAMYTGAGGGGLVCGYGVHFAAAMDEYSIFQYMPGGANCPSLASTTADGIDESAMQPYTSSTWQVPLANGVKFASGGAGDDLSVVFFYPPMPTTLMSTSTANPHVLGASEGTVYLETLDNKASSTVSVSAGGQVNYQ